MNPWTHRKKLQWKKNQSKENYYKSMVMLENLEILSTEYQPLYSDHNRVTHICVSNLSMLQIMACHLYNTEPLSEPMLPYCQLDPKEHILVKFHLKFNSFHSRKCIWKCCLWNGGHFVSAPMCNPSGGRLNKKDGLTRYGHSHVKDKTS